MVIINKCKMMTKYEHIFNIPYITYSKRKKNTYRQGHIIKYKQTMLCFDIITK